MLIMLHTNNLQKMHIASLTWIDSQIEDCVNVKVTDCLHCSLTFTSSLIIEMRLASNVMDLPLSEFISAIIGVVTSTRIDSAEGLVIGQHGYLYNIQLVELLNAPVNNHYKN